MMNAIIGFPRQICRATNESGLVASDDTGNLRATHDFASNLIQLGEAPEKYWDRYIAAVVLARRDATVNREIISMDVGGTNMIDVIQIDQPAGDSALAAIRLSQSPINTGTTAVGEVVFNNAMLACRVASYALYVPKGWAIDYSIRTSDSSNNSLNGNPIQLTFQRLGCVLTGAVATNSNQLTIAGTGLTQNDSIDIGQGDHSACAFKAIHEDAAQAVNISTTDDGSVGAICRVAAAFRLST